MVSSGYEQVVLRGQFDGELFTHTNVKSLAGEYIVEFHPESFFLFFFLLFQHRVLPVKITEKLLPRIFIFLRVETFSFLQVPQFSENFLSYSRMGRFVPWIFGCWKSLLLILVIIPVGFKKTANVINGIFFVLVE